MNDFLGRVTVGDASVDDHAHLPPIILDRYRVWCRGYVSNFQTIARQALGRSASAASMSLACLFALAYERWQGDLDDHVFGEYAAAVLDTSTNVLVLAHDAFGLVPLFYAASDNTLTFSTSLGALVARTGIGTLDEGYLAHLLTLGDAPAGMTPYRHIRCLVPRQHAIWRAGAFKQRQRSFPAKVDPLRYRDDRQYDEHFRDILTTAVASATPSDANVWCELSGGLDSSTVLSVATGCLGRQVAALSWIYPKLDKVDERTWMREVLREHPVPWHTVNGDDLPPFGQLPTGFLPEPTAQIVLRCVAERQLGLILRRHGVEIVLTGAGGDAVLLGDSPGPRFLADLLRHGKLTRLWKQCRAWSDASLDRRSPTYWLLGFGIAGGRYPRFGHTVSVDGRSAPWLQPELRAAIERLPSPLACVPRTTSVADTFYLNSVLGYAKIVAESDRHRATGVSFRNPLFYKPLVDFMRAVPWERKMRPGRDRAIQRRALGGIVPARILGRTDKGAPSQAYYESLASSREWQERLTARPVLAERGYVDERRWRRAVEDACIGRTTSFRHFMAAACLEIWLQDLRRLP